VSKRLAAKNMMYVKIFQAFATNRNIVSPELNHFFSEYTDNVKYTDDEYDIKELKELEARSNECYPFQQLSILNDYMPIKSGLMSLIFKGVIKSRDDDTDADGGDTPIPVVVKYLRKNISKTFNDSMNNLVVFAKFTRYFPYLRTLNVENLILQNIVCLNDQVCFRKELANITLYYKSWNDYPYVKIPKPYAYYTEKINPDIIVMEYIDGMKITEIDPGDNDEFGKALAAFNAKAAFCTSFYHGDLHPGNILFIKTPTAYKIGILDYGIIGHLSRDDQELLFKAMKFMYQRKYNKMIDIIMSCELSESANPENEARLVVPSKDSVKYHKLHEELTDVLVRYTTPELKFFGVTEIYEINYILNNYGLMFKRSLYRLFITIAIMDSIGTRLGSKMSYMQHMTDIIVDMFNIDLDEAD
jgi:predicted unusual protein kinase regulating ubiquinone biosynthesis (AarF/ABC1/UbiB family)